MMWTLSFWRALLERALKSAAQTALLAVGSDALAADAFHFDWDKMAGFAVGGFILSALTSIASGAVTDGSPSLTNAEVLPANPSYDPTHD